MLKVGETSPVKFNVDVHGTSAPPDVRLVISVGTHDLSFKCAKVGDQWQADVKIPDETTPGDYDMRVEVNINSRLFTPLKRRIQIMPADGVKIEAATPATPTQEPAQTTEWEAEGGALKGAPEIPKPLLPPDPQPQVSLLRQFTPEAKTALKSPVKKPAPKPKKIPVLEKKKPEPLVFPKAPDLVGKIVIEKRVLPRPKPVLKEATSIKISIADVAADASKKFDAHLSESKSYEKPVKEARAFSMSPEVPVKLVKGEVVYE